MTANLHQTRTLANLRDPDQLGLPKLLSGEGERGGLKSIKKHLSSEMNQPSINQHWL